MRCAFAVVALGALVSALPVAASERSSQASALTIRLISTPGRTGVKDVPPQTLGQGTPSKGDTIRGTSKLFNAVAQFGKPKGARVGGDTYVFTFTSKTTATVRGTVTLPGGTIRIDGKIASPNPSGRIPVVGGAGAFAGARGVCESRQLTGERSSNVYRLRLP
jgi:hypothetical protein